MFPLIIPVSTCSATPAQGTAAAGETAIAAIEAIHRHSSGVITFHKKVDGKFENLFGIRSEHLRRMWPEFVAKLKSDVFMSLNAYFDRESQPHYLSAVRCRKPDRLQYLCACFADLDCYKLGRTPGQLIGTIVDSQDAGLIPPASVIVKSGRGIWLLWLLHDPRNPAVAQRAWPETQMAYHRLQRRIHECLAHLGADAQDALRIARVPGSLHSIAGVQVSYLVQADEASNLYTYTLDELADWFRVKSTETPLLGRQEAPERSIQGRSRGPQALTEYRMGDFAKLVDLRRGGFDEGCRNRAAMYYAWLLKCRRVPITKATELVLELGRRCRPPLSPSECCSAVKSGYGRWQSYVGTQKKAPPSIRYQTVSDWLDIKPQEAKYLLKYPAAQRFKRNEPETKPRRTRRVEQHDRQVAIRRIVEELAHVPSLRHMEKLLRATGHPASYVTVKKDYESLKLSAKASPTVGGG